MKMQPALVPGAIFLVVPAFLLDISPPSARADGGLVRVEILEGIPDKRSWEFEVPEPIEHYFQDVFAFVAVPKKWSNKAILIDRSSPFVIRATAVITLPQGEYRLLIRSRNAARLHLDDKLIGETAFVKPNASGHESVPDLPVAMDSTLRPLPVGHQEKMISLDLDGAEHHFRFEAFVGGQKLRHEVGELVLAVAHKDQPFFVLGPESTVPLSDDGWTAWTGKALGELKNRDESNRKAAGAEEDRYWKWRHELARRHWIDQPAIEVPDVTRQYPVHNAVDRFIGHRLEQQSIAPAALAEDLAFLRRVTLDTVGVIPTRDEIDAFLNDEESSRRARAIDRLLRDSRWADHWVAYWQDVLAENPGILKPTLNNTGPFRWWIHQAFRENMAMDRFVTELLMMQGSVMGGGPAGFSMATLNDAPMAAKAHVAAKAFLGVELQCARCHDAPYHDYKQEDLFSVAAMLAKGPLKVPATSTVPVAERTRRPLVRVTIEPGTAVQPEWPFGEFMSDELPAGVLREDGNPRERLAALITSPRNVRFGQVLVNRLWRRYFGLGLVEPVDDWTDPRPSHSELLDFLSRELIVSGYDLQHVARLILNSHAYQRVAVGHDVAGDPENRMFVAPARRRLTAEQLVDSLFLAAGKDLGAEELNLDVDGRRPITEFLNLGTPRRAWEFTSLSNERDRPALALPIAQSIVDLLVAFGWRESRQNPITVRDETPTPLQPLLLANGVAGSRVTCLSDDSSFTTLCLEDRPIDELVTAVFLQVLTRPPTETERAMFVELLEDGYATRRVSAVSSKGRPPSRRATAVSWSNHLSPEATRLKMEQERAARAGDPPTERLQSDWRERMEDMLWSLMNSPEFLFIP